MSAPHALVWVRNDLRLADNPALAEARKTADAVTAIYIHETDKALRQPGGAARWWLHQSLEDLGPRLAKLGIDLVVREGEAATELDAVISESGANAVHWNRRYAPGERRIDAAIKSDLRERDIEAHSHSGNVLVEPWDIATGQGKPYSVFTPFWKNLREHDIALPLPAPEQVGKQSSGLKRYDADYKAPEWSGKLNEHWSVGEEAAAERLADFLDQALADYPEGRDFPSKEVTSRLSPHLRFGEISARQIWHAAQARAHADHSLAKWVDKFLSELAWRDFSYHQLFHREDISQKPMQEKYAGIEWRSSTSELHAWRQGQTGIPIVDAGMRQLWETGYMHNRVRMLVASLLAKNLLIDWRLGENWFWDCLVDADVANNPASWQWVAGSGLDASPYFRIFNPVTQGTRFDPDGDYVRQWVPELKNMPDKWVHEPSAAPADVLKTAGVRLGEDYPEPIVDLKSSRQRALDTQAALA